MMQEAYEDFGSCQWEAGSHVCLYAFFGTERFLPLAERLTPFSSSYSILSRRPLQTLRVDVMTTCGHHVEINALRGERCTGKKIVASLDVSDANIAKSLH